jgi:hypothetical protein
VIYDDLPVVLPKGKKKLTQPMINLLDDSFTPAKWNGCANTEGCKVIFFTNKPVMRNPNKRLRVHTCGRTKKGRFKRCR